MPAVQTPPVIIEGTWDEVSRQVDKFAGHRLRVEILPDADRTPLPATGRYAMRVSPLLEAAASSVPATPEEIARNRRRDGAEPLF